MIVTARHLIENPQNRRRHVVLLGAGASRQAFADGDATGRIVPLMCDLVDIIELQPLLEDAGIETGHEKNFEVIYSRLSANPKQEHLAEKIERRLAEYFTFLSLPDQATLYDRLLLSLRPKDAVFTFNWDPFLFDAYQRNRHAVSLPEIFFLHGNVRIGACRHHDIWGARGELCPDCDRPFENVPILLPHPTKNYSPRYISSAWEAARIHFRQAFTLTLFGYGAPTSDADAVDLLHRAWLADSARAFEHIEIIDKAKTAVLHGRWSRFTPTLHYRIQEKFEYSRIGRWPRRSCESLLYPMSEGRPCEDFPPPETDSLVELQQYAAELTKYESDQSFR